MLAVGVDGWKRGWVAVMLRGSAVEVDVFDGLDRLADVVADAAAIVVDIPVGLPEGRRVREADKAAKRLLGKRASSIFFAPPRVVLEAATYAEARAVARDVWGRGVSSQAYRGLRAKILEVDPIAAADPRIVEGHPEVSFAALAGEPMAHHKKTWNGQMTRRSLLESEGIPLPEVLVGGAGEAPPDDVVDAAVLAWTARRVAAGRASSIPQPPEIIGDRKVAIWF